MGFLLKAIQALTRRLPAWLRLPVIGGSFFAGILAIRFVIAVVADRAPDAALGEAALAIPGGFAVGFAAGLVTYITWRTTRPLGRLGYSVTGACTLVAYMFAVAALIAQIKGASAMPDSMSMWWIFILYPAGLGALAGWLRYPRDQVEPGA